jgi:hypothetical protein
MASEIKVDTVSEKTSANGVTIDGVNIKDSKIATANSIDSDVYVDGSIDNAHIADDAIDSEHYAAGSIDTAHIANDQITLALMAGGTDGNLISYDTSGNPVAVATGSDGQVLTSSGSGAVCAFEDAAGGSWTKISNISGDDSITEANFTTLSTDYIDFKVIGTNVVPGSDAQDFHFRYSVSTTFLTSGYGWAKSGTDEAGTEISAGSTSAATMPLNHDGCGNAGGENVNFELTIYDPHDTANVKVVKYKVGYINSSGVLTSLNGAGINDGNVAAVDGLRFYFASGTIKSGEITLYARKIT